MAIKQVQAVVNGITATLQLNSETGKYEATMIAPNKSSYPQQDHYYDVTVTAIDEAGNSVSVNSKDATLGPMLRLTVLENVPPVITISAPTDSQLLTNNQPTIIFTVKDNDSGVDPDTIILVIDGAEIVDIEKTASSSGGYICTYTPEEPLSDGNHTVFGKATDHDGNEGVGEAIPFTIDTIPPELSVINPVNNYITNRSTVTVEGITNDETSSPVTLSVNGTPVTVFDNGTFSTIVTLEEGVNSITVIATDGAGRSTTVTRTVIKDTIPPVITDVSLSPNPADIGATYVISVSVTDS